MRALRRAEGFADSSSRWAHFLGLQDTAVSNYETGFRRVSRDAALRIRERVPGFDPVWLWTGDERALPVALRDRLREAEAIERAAGEPDRRLNHAER